MGQPSQTAQRVVFARAWESDRPAETRVCYDPIAKHLLSDEGKFLLNTSEGRNHFEENFAGPVWDTFLDYVALRTRVIDSFLLDAAKEGFDQLLILGAGYDSRALRVEELQGKTRVFEVDQPGTQEDKKAKLVTQYGSLPDNVTYVPVDFEKDDLAACLLKAGLVSDLKTMLIWEGVTYYLDPQAVEHTLEFVRNHISAGSIIVFDYAFSQVADGSTKNPLMQTLIKMAGELGEPLKFGLKPESVEEYLSRRGFREIVDYPIEQCMQRFLTPANGKRNPFAEYSIVKAKVAP